MKLGGTGSIIQAGGAGGFGHFTATGWGGDTDAQPLASITKVSHKASGFCFCISEFLVIIRVDCLKLCLKSLAGLQLLGDGLGVGLGDPLELAGMTGTQAGQLLAQAPTLNAGTDQQAETKSTGADHYDEAAHGQHRLVRA